MMTFYVHTIADIQTGEIVRFIIAEEDLPLGLDINETVSDCVPLAGIFGTDYPTTIIQRHSPAQGRIRIITPAFGERPSQAESVSGDDLAAGLWGERSS